MKAKRAEFSKNTKAAAFMRCRGICECGCGRKILGSPEYHHAIPAAIGGEATLENCVVIDTKCHAVQTNTVDKPEIAKTKRVIEKRAGIKRKGRPLAGTKASGWSRRMDGTVVRRSK